MLSQSCHSPSRRRRTLQALHCVVVWALPCACASLGTGCPAVLDLDGPLDAADAEVGEPEPAFAEGVPPSEREGGAPPHVASCQEPPSATGLAGTFGAGHRTITSPEQAVQAVERLGFAGYCGSSSVPARQLDDGYEVVALKQTRFCPPEQSTRYRLHVSRAGEVRVLEHTLHEGPAGRCDAGLPDAGSAPPAPAPLAAKLLPRDRCESRRREES